MTDNAEKLEEGYGGIRLMEADIPLDRLMIFSAGKVYLFSTTGALLKEADVNDFGPCIQPPQGDEG